MTARTLLIGSAAAVAVVIAAAAGLWLSFAGDRPPEGAVSVIIDVPSPAEGFADASAESGEKSGEKSGSATVVDLPQDRPQDQTLERVARTPAEWLDEPDPALAEEGGEGWLPKIGDDGREPWLVYARPFDVRGDRPRVAVVVTGIGLSGADTAKATQRLPSAVTLAFSPYSRNLGALTRQARADGHEILLTLPLQRHGFPFLDAGPAALQPIVAATAGRAETNGLEPLSRILGRTFGYVGVAAAEDSPVTSQPESLRALLAAIGGRGLMFVAEGPPEQSLVDDLAADIKVPWAVANIRLDDVLTVDAIDAALAELENIAEHRAVALGIARSYPLIIDRLAAWASGLDERGVSLAPVSALADRQLFP